jgi:hypothetical protein
MRTDEKSKHVVGNLRRTAAYPRRRAILTNFFEHLLLSNESKGASGWRKVFLPGNR